MSKDSYERKYQLLINKCEGADLKYVNESKAFLEFSNKKLLLTSFFFFTTSFFEGMIIKLLATCQGPSRQKHIKFVMTLTGAEFQVCFAIIG